MSYPRRMMTRMPTFSRPAAALLLVAASAASAAPPDAPNALLPVEQHTVNLFEAASPSVVNISTLVRGRVGFSRRTVEVPAGSGTGFVWDADGHIVTNFHVIRQASGATVTFDDQTQVKAELVGVSADHDLAVLKVARPEDAPLRPLPRGRSADLRVGQHVYAIGNPFGLDHTLTTGVVSALDREIDTEVGRYANGQPITRTLDGVVQSDAAINPGNSGGPLLDSGGRVIGVNTMIYSPSGASAGVGFSIPIDTVARVVPQLIENRAYVRPQLGIELRESVTGPILQRLGRTGVLFIAVAPNTPAKRAGLEPTFRDALGQLVIGDLIVGVEDEVIETIDDLLNALERTLPGQTISVKVVRRGEETEIAVTMR